MQKRYINSQFLCSDNCGDDLFALLIIICDCVHAFVVSDCDDIITVNIVRDHIMQAALYCMIIISGVCQ